MKKENTPVSIPEADSSRITFVKSLCSRIQEALEDIEDVFEKVANPIKDTCCLGKSEGIGLFLYVRDKEGALKEQYPEFTDDQIVSILLAQWEKLDDTEKEEYCSKINEKKFNKTKKQKKMEKMFEKLVETVSSTEKGGSFDEDEGSSESLSFGTKAKSKYFEIEEEEEDDSIPKKKMMGVSVVFAEDQVTVEEKEIEEGKRSTPRFQKLEFDVIHEKSEQNENEQKPKEQEEKANHKIADENLMQIESCNDQKVSESSPKENEEVQLHIMQKDNQVIVPLENETAFKLTQKEGQINEQQSPLTPENSREFSPSLNSPSEIPPSDDIVEAVSNQIQSTRECDTCFGVEQIAVEGVVEENRNILDSPVLIECPSESNSLPLPERKRNSQTEEPEQPKIEHHQEGEMSEHEEEKIVTKFETTEFSQIDDIEPKIEYKEHSENPFFDEKGEDYEELHQNIPKEIIVNTVEIPQLFSSKSLKEECKNEQKELVTNINESINEDERLIKMEVKQDNTCTEQQEQVEFE